MTSQPKDQFATIPMRSVGPAKLVGQMVSDELMLPLATFETTLFPSIARGAKISRLTAGIQTTLLDDRMTRSICLSAQSALQAKRHADEIVAYQPQLAVLVSESSSYAKLINIHTQVIGNNIFLRFEYTTGDAAGHNMTTKATNAILHWITKTYPGLEYASLSGNFCTDKKVSAVNGLLGRGKAVIAEMQIPADILSKHLRTSVDAMLNLHLKKNLLGSVAAGSLRSANAHYANMLLAIYLATGQDAANIVEGSQGITHLEARDGGLYFSVTVPHIIVGTVGNGKGLDFVQQNLRQLGCMGLQEPGEAARRLACIVAATVLCGELSLMAALTNPDELMRAHHLFERQATEG